MLQNSLEELVELRREIRGDVTDRQRRIAAGLQEIRERMPHASFMAWYAGTSLDDVELERQVNAKLAQLGGA